ncbi:MAG: UPF0149 family protein [Sphingomonadales bacterium]
MTRAREERLDRLESMLFDVPAEAGGMLLDEFDGFVAGLLVCPEYVPPEEWVPKAVGIFEADAPDRIVDPQLRSLLIAHYDDVRHDLSDGQTLYQPVFSEDPRSGEILWELWAEGFAAAFFARGDSWLSILDEGDTEASAALSLLVSLAATATGTAEPGEEAPKGLIEIAHDIIPGCIETLFLHKMAHGGIGNRLQFVRPGRKIGRNEPCLCGSGKKYKKCCGAGSA